VKNGIIVVSVLGVLSFAMHFTANWLEMQPTPENEKFKVVDRYDNRCDVVQYTPTYSARYSYFLDCRK